MVRTPVLASGITISAFYQLKKESTRNRTSHVSGSATWMTSKSLIESALDRKLI
ncbi:hypothetical protein MTR_4g130600 [Medicago truncatula]|uniref:Uncharacterized protein n=1 Tax=Medicago truncatula TaxID=3880 RepID=G7JFK7_MEDTR|nr:hypothetical protein MTR_4g130600 [Medicago truncatula]